jgi:hypothetical protein
VPLSEHEQRLLEQMERALYAEDPKFASTLRGTDLRSHYRRRALQSAIGFVLGIALLMTGVVAKDMVMVSVLGFLLMLASAVFAVSNWRRIPGADDGTAAAAAAPGAKPKKRRGPRRGIIDRFEERWRRRRDEPGR